MQKRRAFPCPCGTGLQYDTCCGKFHNQPKKAGQIQENPGNALLLMRSRYTAYALGLPEYIIQTTHPLNLCYMENTSLWKQEILSFHQNTVFEKVEILEFIDGSTEAYVTFKAHLRSPQKRCVSFTEKSYFVRENDQWLYRECIFIKPCH